MLIYDLFNTYLVSSLYVWGFTGKSLPPRAAQVGKKNKHKVSIIRVMILG